MATLRWLRHVQHLLPHSPRVPFIVTGHNRRKLRCKHGRSANGVGRRAGQPWRRYPAGPHGCLQTGLQTLSLKFCSQKFSECFLLNPEGGCAADSAAGMGAVGAGAAGVGAAGVGAAGAAAERGACNIHEARNALPFIQDGHDCRADGRNADGPRSVVRASRLWPQFLQKRAVGGLVVPHIGQLKGSAWPFLRQYYHN